MHQESCLTLRNRLLRLVTLTCDAHLSDRNYSPQRDGYGVLTFADGSRYCGMFSEGMCSGKGVLTFPDNSKYEGEFSNGKYDGHGVYQRGDNMKFEGQFRAGQVSGRYVSAKERLQHFAPADNAAPRC